MIKIGDTQVPRAIETNYMETILEDVNEAIEVLSEYSDGLENRFSELSKAEMKKYWANLITLFGIFLAIFSLITVALPRIDFPYYYNYKEIFLANSVQVIPVAIVLGIFIVILKLIFR
jgi:polyferredoxin